MNRRDFISSCVRNLVLAGVVLMSGFLIFREENDEPCEFDFVCKKCKKLDSCTLPEARVVKSNS